MKTNFDSKKYTVDPVEIETYERKEKMWQLLTYAVIIGTLAVIITQCVLWAKGI